MSQSKDFSKERTRLFQPLKISKDSKQSRVQSLLSQSRKARDELIKKARDIDVSIETKQSFDISRLPLWIETIKAQRSQEEVLHAVENLRISYAFDTTTPTEQAIQSGIIPILVSYLSVDFPILVITTIWVLTNLAAGSSLATDIMVASSAVKPLVNFLYNPNNNLREQALWALCNISGDTIENRAVVIKENILEAIQEVSKSEENETVFLNAWLILNLVQHNEQWHYVKSFIPILTQYIYKDNDEILTHTCNALSYITNCQDVHLATIIESGACKRLVELMNHKEVRIKTPCLKAIGNILFGDESQVQVLINLNVLDAYSALLKNSHPDITKLALWGLSNITAGTADHIHAVLGKDLLDDTLKIAQNAKSDVKKEALIVLINAIIGASPKDVDYLVSRGYVEAICQAFDMCYNDIIFSALEAIEMILKHGVCKSGNDPRSRYLDEVEASGGFDEIEKLKYSTIEGVSEKACKILDVYFPSNMMM